MRYAIRFLFLLILIYSYSGCGAPNYTTRIDQSQTFLRNQQYDMAKIEIMKLIEAYPEKPEPYYLLGLMNYATGKYNECLLNFVEAERRDIDKSSEFYLNKGIALYKTGNLIEAEKNFDILAKFESNTTAQKYLGLIRYEFGDYSGSINAFRKASSIKNDENSLYIFGMALYHQGMNAESLGTFMMAYNLAPDNEKIIFQTANLLMLNGRNDDAISMYSKIPSGSVYRDVSIYNQAEACIKTGDFERAAELLENYIDVRPDDYKALYNLSSALIKTGEYVYATDILQRLIDDEIYHIIATYNLGLANYKLGKYAESVHYFSEVVEQDPENTTYRYAYGLALPDYGDTEEARKQMKTILSLDPGNADAQEWLNRHQNSEEISE